MRSETNSSPLIIEVTRGELIESRHRGSIAAVDGRGRLAASVGDISVRTWYRSAAKPFQTLALVESGAAEAFGLTPAELSVITGSHSGEEIHLEAVRAILEKTGLTETSLLCGAHMPFDDAAARELRSSGRSPSVLHNNCSGKHAGMLAFCRHLGAPVENYIDPGHPIQRRIRSLLAEFSGIGEDEIDVAIDGCSAPVFGLTIEEMARGYGALVAGSIHEGSAARVVGAMIEYPEMVGGSRKRLDTDLMRVMNGSLISKVGAEGVQLLGVRPNGAYPHGLGIAIKIEDGDIRRARDPVVIETLRHLGLIDPRQAGALSAYAGSKLFNYRGLEVGEVRPAFTLVNH